MYRSEKNNNPMLFPKLFHLGGRLDDSNRWLKLGEAMPWEKLDELYGKYFTKGYGRPAKDSRLITGLLTVKLIKNLSDEEAVQEFMENPYMQAFCGAEYFAVEDVISSSVLSERRKRLGADFFSFFDSEVGRVIRDSKTFRLRSAKDPSRAGLIGRVINKIKTLFN